MSTIPLTITDITVFDPGQTTGYSIWKRNEKTEKFFLWKSGTFDTWERCEELIAATDYVVSERVEKKRGNFNDIGVGVMYVIKYLCEVNNVQFDWRKPSMMQAPKKFASKFIAQFPEHVCDTIAHAISYISVDQLEGFYYD